MVLFLLEIFQKNILRFPILIVELFVKEATINMNLPAFTPSFPFETKSPQWLNMALRESHAIAVYQLR